MTTINRYSQRCPENQTQVGLFHTHPKGNMPYMSDWDTVNAYDLGISCIGARKEINCFVRKGAYKETTSNLTKEIVRENENIQEQLYEFFKNNFRKKIFNTKIKL